MGIEVIIVIALGYIAFGLFSNSIAKTPITAPILFASFGWLIGASGLGILSVDIEHGFIHTLAEATLILVLFSDASRINAAQLKHDHALPVRMLLIGMPLTILLGCITGLLLFPALKFWEVALIAAMLAPTDAALGQAVVSSKVVPERIRQALNVESGLNDGIALPIILLFACFTSAGHSGGEQDGIYWLRFGLLQIILGPIVGIMIGYMGAKLVNKAVDKDWMSGAFEGIAAIAMAVLAFAAAEAVHGNGFISAFTAGLVFGNGLARPCQFLREFTESEGQLLTLATFLIFGAVMFPEILHGFQPLWLVYAILSLTLVRMLPIALSLIGTHISLPSKAFLGWFGPRGLASILFLLLILEETETPNHHEIFGVVITTVALSIMLHGLSAVPLSQWYGRFTKSRGECEENRLLESPTHVGFET
jgi:sodium/hydrogen antiporter